MVDWHWQQKYELKHDVERNVAIVKKMSRACQNRWKLKMTYWKLIRFHQMDITFIVEVLINDTAYESCSEKRKLDQYFKKGSFINYGTLKSPFSAAIK